MSSYLQFQDEDVKFGCGIVEGEGTDEGRVVQAAQQLVLVLRCGPFLPNATHELHCDLQAVTVPLTPLHYAKGTPRMTVLGGLSRQLAELHQLLKNLCDTISSFPYALQHE